MKIGAIMSGTGSQEMEVDFDQAQAEAARETTGESGGMDIMEMIAKSEAYTPSEMCGQAGYDPDQEAAESTSDFRLMSALEGMYEKYGDKAGRRYFGRFERRKMETEGEHGPWPIEALAMVQGVTEAEFWEIVGPEKRPEDQTIRVIIEMVASEREALNRAKGINPRAHVQRLYHIWLFLRALVASPEAWKKDKMPHAAAATRAMVAGPGHRYTRPRVARWADSAPLVTEAKVPLAAAPTALGCGNKSICQERRKGETMNCHLRATTKTPREATLIEKGKPTGEGNADLGAGKRKFLAWAR